MGLCESFTKAEAFQPHVPSMYGFFRGCRLTVRRGRHPAEAGPATALWNNGSWARASAAGAFPMLQPRGARLHKGAQAKTHKKSQRLSPLARMLDVSLAYFSGPSEAGLQSGLMIVSVPRTSFWSGAVRPMMFSACDVASQLGLGDEGAEVIANEAADGELAGLRLHPARGVGLSESPCPTYRKQWRRFPSCRASWSRSGPGLPTNSARYCHAERTLLAVMARAVQGGCSQVPAVSNVAYRAAALESGVVAAKQGRKGLRARQPSTSAERSVPAIAEVPSDRAFDQRVQEAVDAGRTGSSRRQQRPSRCRERYGRQRSGKASTKSAKPG